MRIAIVNDMSMAVEALRRVIASVPCLQLAWAAENGAEAVRQSAADPPDLILMDLVMPVMDGVEATRCIMSKNPCAILIVTADVGVNAGKVFDAMGAGALDVVQTPILGGPGRPKGREHLLLKIEEIRGVISEGSDRSTAGKHLRRGPASNDCLVVIGASAGGPAALAVILSELPRDFQAPIVIVQHIDEHFAPSMAVWLGEQSRLKVRVARERDQPAAGTVLIAATNDHLVFLDSSTIGYTKEPEECNYRPSIDVFFESVARFWKGEVVAVVLTGMGRDGAKGLKTLRRAGGLTIAQDAGSSVVYGMPKAAAELGAAVEILPLNRIASALVSSQRAGMFKARKVGS